MTPDLRWVDDGYAYLAAHMDELTDEQLDEPCGLPGWSRRHVLAHVGFNARALRRLVRWAATGEVTPMYADNGARAAEIETGAQLPAAELRALVHNEHTALRTELAELPADRWAATVVTAQGREVAATEIPWMRTREVWVHAVDLNNGADFTDFPAGLLDALVSDVVATWRRRHQGVALADLTRWLTGRGGSPAIGRWL